EKSNGVAGAAPRYCGPAGAATSAPTGSLLLARSPALVNACSVRGEGRRAADHAQRNGDGGNNVRTAGNLFELRVRQLAGLGGLRRQHDMPAPGLFLMEDDLRQLRLRHVEILDEAAGGIGDKFLAERVVLPAALDELGFDVLAGRGRCSGAHEVLRKSKQIDRRG